MDFSPDELAMLDGLETPAPAAVLPPDAPSSDKNTPPPEKKTKAKKSRLQIVDKTADAEGSCDDCGLVLNASNGSKRTNGTWKHIGCPVGTPTQQAEEAATATTAFVAPVASVQAPKQVDLEEAIAAKVKAEEKPFPDPAPTPQVKRAPSAQPPSASPFTVTKLENGSVRFELSAETVANLRSIFGGAL